MVCLDTVPEVLRYLIITIPEPPAPVVPPDVEAPPPPPPVLAVPLPAGFRKSPVPPPPWPPWPPVWL